MIYLIAAALAMLFVWRLYLDNKILDEIDGTLDLMKKLDHRVRWLEGHQDRVIDAEVIENDNHNFRS